MRKWALVGMIALVAFGVLAPTAGAQVLQQGPNRGKLTDWGSFFYDDGGDATTASPLAVMYQTGSGVSNLPSADGTTFDRTIFKITELYQPTDNTVPYFDNSAPVEIIGLVYDLVVEDVRLVSWDGSTLDTDSATNDGNVFRVDVDLAAGGRFAGYEGRVDVWVDPAEDWVPPIPAPSNWTAVSGPVGPYNPFAPGNYDTFPNASDGFPLLSGTLVRPNVNDPTLITLSLWVDQDPFTSAFNAGQGVASTSYILSLVNLTGVPLAPDYLGGRAEIEFNNRFSFYPNTSISYEGPFDNPTTQAIWWDTSSEDPIFFRPLPEPASLALLGMGLVGLVGAKLKRRKQ